MNLWESIRVALEGIQANKLRSFLTTLGIVIGIAAVIAVVAVGQGGRTLLMNEMEKFGINVFVVHIDWRKSALAPGDFTLQDVTVVKELVPEISHLAPVSYGRAAVRGPAKTRQGVQVIGTTGEYSVIRNLEMKTGRFLTTADQTGLRPVVVLDEELASDLFGRRQPVGEKAVINGVPLQVVGVIKKTDSMISFGSSQRAYITQGTWPSVYNYRIINELWGSAADRGEVQKALEQTVKIMERRHRVPDRYTGFSMEQEMAMANRTTGIMTMIIGSIAGISLFVGGIGVMNIMLVSVTERTREIGIRMALGARRKDILTQFLIEAVVLCLLGGIIGTALGLGGALLVAKVFKLSPPLAVWPILVAFGFSALVGIVFGILPANKASRLNPIDALRHE